MKKKKVGHGLRYMTRRGMNENYLKLTHGATYIIPEPWHAWQALHLKRLGALQLQIRDAWL